MKIFILFFIIFTTFDTKILKPHLSKKDYLKDKIKEISEILKVNNKQSKKV